MDSQEPIVVTMYLGRSDNDDLWEERNTLAVALRTIKARADRPSLHPSSVDFPQYRITLWDEIMTMGEISMAALREVFPEDPLGEQAIYDCPSADGTNRLRDEMERGRP